MVMDEKEVLKKIKNSFRVGKSRADVTQALQNYGYKLEYIDEMIKKAEAPKKLLVISAVVLVVILAIATTSYFVFFSNSKSEILNPLEGYKVNFGQSTGDLSEINIEDIVITPEFISYLLNEVGAWNLRKSPLTLENPIINFQIDETYFNSEITKGKISTKSGSSNSADISFVSTKVSIVKAIIDDAPVEIFKESISSGETTIQKIADDTELFAKGYLDLYNELSS